MSPHAHAPAARDGRGPPRILVVGGGTAGWMTAAALGWAFAGGVAEVGLVDSEEIGTVGVGEATVPHIRFFNRRLGIDEAAFVRATSATMKLGIEFRDWGRIGDSYVHPFGDFGHDLDGLPFHLHWLRLSREGAAPPLEDCSLPVAMARAGRFAPPADDPRSVRSTYSYAYQFDAGRYAAFLRAYAEERGVTRTEGRVTEVERGPAGIAAVRLADGRRLEADLFVDCTGFRALLVEGALGAGWDNWSEWLPCDAAWAVPCEAAPGPLAPYTRATAREAGWQWRIPLQHRVGNGHVFATRFLGEDAAREQLLSTLEGRALAEPKLLRFRAGRRRRQWIGNAVAVGLSSGFLEPLESTSIHLIQLAVTKLIELFPADGRPDPAAVAEFDRAMAVEYDRVRDFLVLHYRATTRDDTAFWRYVRSMPLPDGLEEKLATFREAGVVPSYREGMFLPASWIAVLYGQGWRPDAVPPLVAALPVEQARARVDAVATACRRAADTAPGHDAWLAELCAGATA